MIHTLHRVATAAMNLENKIHPLLLILLLIVTHLCFHLYGLVRDAYTGDFVLVSAQCVSCWKWAQCRKIPILWPTFRTNTRIIRTKNRWNGALNLPPYIQLYVARPLARMCDHGKIEYLKAVLCTYYYDKTLFIIYYDGIVRDSNLGDFALVLTLPNKGTKTLSNSK